MENFSCVWQEKAASQVSKAAAMNQLRRICMPKSSGQLDVSQEVHEKFKNKGAGRDELLECYMKECKLDKAWYIRIIAWN